MMRQSQLHPEQRWWTYAKWSAIVIVISMLLVTLLFMVIFPFTKCAQMKEDYQSCKEELQEKKSYLKDAWNVVNEAQCDHKLMNFQSACYDDRLIWGILVIVILVLSIVLGLLDRWNSREATWQEEKAVLQKEKTTLQGEKGILQEEKTNLWMENIKLRKEKDSMHREMSDLQTKNATLEADFKNKKREVNELQQKNATLGEDIETKRTSMQRELSDLLQRNATLQAENNASLSKLSTLESINKALHKQNSDLQEEWDKLFWVRWFKKFR